MHNIPQLESLHSFLQAYQENPRVSTRELHRKYSHYRNRRSTTTLIREAKRNNVLMGPRLWCNSGCDVEIYEQVDDPLSLLETVKQREEVTYATALIGDPSLICFKNGAPVLTYAEAITPSFPAKKTITDISLEKKGKLKPDPFPDGWNDTNWAVFHHMRDPTSSFVKVGRKLGISWHTVKNHYEKIVKDCKTWITFLPRGYDRYQQVYFMFKTEYENNLREELQKLDRTSLMYKFNDTILLHLFLDDIFYHLHQYYRFFFNFNKKGIIHDLHVSIPLEWYSPYW